MKQLFALLLLLSASLFVGRAEAAVQCGWGTVMGQLQQVCWWEDDPPGGGGGGGGGPGTPPGGGGGGGINPDGVWADVNVDGRTIQVNLVQKKVRDLSISCSDDTTIHQRSAGAILIRSPWLPSATGIRLIVSDGSWVFFRENRSGTLQMAPVLGQSCG